MNKQAENLLRVAALGALGYALYRHFKPATGQGGAAGAPASAFNVKNLLNPFNEATTQEFDMANPGAYISLSSLLNGAIHDIMTGDKAGQTPATIYEIEQSALGDIYGTGGMSYNESRGMVGQDSVVRLPNAYW